MEHWFFWFLVLDFWIWATTYPAYLPAAVLEHTHHTSHRIAADRAPRAPKPARPDPARAHPSIRLRQSTTPVCTGVRPRPPPPGIPHIRACTHTQRTPLHSTRTPRAALRTLTLPPLHSPAIAATHPSSLPVHPSIFSILHIVISFVGHSRLLVIYLSIYFSFSFLFPKALFPRLPLPSPSHLSLIHITPATQPLVAPTHPTHIQPSYMSMSIPTSVSSHLVSSCLVSSRLVSSHVYVHPSIQPVSYRSGSAFARMRIYTMV